jgi:hypothetical protein
MKEPTLQGLTIEDTIAFYKERNAKARAAMTGLFDENTRLKARVEELEGIIREYEA